MRPIQPTGTPGSAAAHAPTGGRVPVPAPRRSGPEDGGPVTQSVGLIGPAWIVREVTHVPGVLRLAAGRLTFVSTRATLFDRPLAELGDLSFPWYGFSGAFRVTVGDERLRVHVVRPSGAVAPEASFLARLLAAADLPATDGETAAGARWRAVLERPRGRRA